MMIIKAVKYCFIASTMPISFQRNAQNWQMKPMAMQSRWAKDVSLFDALKEYPRPRLVRLGWANLNGLSKYAIISLRRRAKMELKRY